MNDKKYEANRKLKEYEMKIIKMSGHLTDHYIDEALETDDFSIISGFLIDYFSGTVGKTFDVGYLISKYKEFGLNEKIEDVDFNIDEWYKMKFEINKPIEIEDEEKLTSDMSEDEYIKYLIDKRKK